MKDAELKTCPYCENKVLTNADRIRSMSDDELNDLFYEIYNAGVEDTSSYEWGQRTNSFEWTMDWLQLPTEMQDGCSAKNLQSISDMPAADVAPVVHGHWIEQEDGNLDTYYTCSSCKEDFDLIAGTPCENLYNYCPSCGAKMDEKEDR